jgi:hypothetical protein
VKSLGEGARAQKLTNGDSEGKTRASLSGCQGIGPVIGAVVRFLNARIAPLLRRERADAASASGHCSDFVVWVYGARSHKLPHNSGGQPLKRPYACRLSTASTPGLPNAEGRIAVTSLCLRSYKGSNCFQRVLSALCRFCCKSLFAHVIKISFGCTRDFRVNMWGTSLPEEKLAGDLGNVIGATSIGGRRSDFFTARNLAPGNLGLLQQYLQSGVF